MGLSSSIRDSLLEGIHVLDGGMASELEHAGADLSGPLWSAHLIDDSPEKIVDVHRAYIDAGAEIIETASYQVSRMGYAEAGLLPLRADHALLRSVALARKAAGFFPDRRVLIAASLGPYGAALHNGAEYHGNYDATFADLVQFHAERIGVFSAAQPAEAPDVLAFETLPSLAEGEAIGEALALFPEMPAWFTFSCRDERHVSHGELLRQCAKAVASFPQTIAIGVNCTHPNLISALIEELRNGSDKPIIVYPNSGEAWDAASRCWISRPDPSAYDVDAARWFAAGAQIVGGCCRTRPLDISKVRRASPAGKMTER